MSEQARAICKNKSRRPRRRGLRIVRDGFFVTHKNQLSLTTSLLLSAKDRVCFACSLASALTTAARHYHSFAVFFCVADFVSFATVFIVTHKNHLSLTPSRLLSAKDRVCFACSLASALTTAARHYHSFAVFFCVAHPLRKRPRLLRLLGCKRPLNGLL